MKKEIEADFYRYTGKEFTKCKMVYLFIKNYSFRFIFLWRKIQSKSVLSFLYRSMFKSMSKKYGLEFPLKTKIGKGILMLHARNITLNSKAVIGNNCTILKGATIGNTKRGDKQGSPTIGDDVYIGLNATVVGKINIGNNVLIAPNAYINFDVPNDTIVIGNPGVCHHSQYATDYYIANRYE